MTAERSQTQAEHHNDRLDQKSEVSQTHTHSLGKLLVTAPDVFKFTFYSLGCEAGV